MVKSFRGSADRFAWLTIDPCTIHSVWYQMEYVNAQLSLTSSRSSPADPPRRRHPTLLLRARDEVACAGAGTAVREGLCFLPVGARGAASTISGC
jgi:hypothetical protein